MALPQTAAAWDLETDVIRLAKCYRGRQWFPKLRLFAVACCRRIWGLLPPGLCREAVETAERFEAGLATKQELRAACTATWAEMERSRYLIGRAGRSYSYREPDRSLALAAWACTLPAEHPAVIAPRHVLNVLSYLRYQEGIAAGASHASASHTAEEARRAEMAQMVTLLRAMVGNPFEVI